jgi:hypothetical protein
MALFGCRKSLPETTTRNEGEWLPYHEPYQQKAATPRQPLQARNQEPFAQGRQSHSLRKWHKMRFWSARLF